MLNCLHTTDILIIIFIIFVNFALKMMKFFNRCWCFLCRTYLQIRQPFIHLQYLIFYHFQLPLLSFHFKIFIFLLLIIFHLFFLLIPFRRIDLLFLGLIIADPNNIRLSHFHWEIIIRVFLFKLFNNLAGIWVFSEGTFLDEINFVFALLDILDVFGD